MDSKFKIGDKFVEKNSRDSMVMSIDCIYYHFGQEVSYELKPIGFCGDKFKISESTLSEKYDKIN